jgi:Kef-type K+ transport system membrane component KefB
MRQVIKKTANSDIPRSVVEIIAGVIFLAVPGYVSELLWVISAVLFIALGLYDLVRFIANIVIDKSRVTNTRMILLRAVLLIVFGVVLLVLFNLCMLLYDRLMLPLVFLYVNRIRPRFKTILQ